MSVTSENVVIDAQFALSATTPFGSVTTPAGTALSFSLTGISTTTWNQIYAATYTIFVTTISDLAATASATTGTLAAGTYYYKVAGVGPNGPLTSNTIQSNSSNEASVALSGSNSASLTWSALQGATSYNVYRGTGAGLENTLVANVTTNSYVDSGAVGTAGSPPSAPATFIEFDVRAFTNLVGESVTATKGLGVVLAASGTNAQALFAPGTTNGLTWFFSGTTPGIQLPNGGGVIAICAQPTYAGQTIDSTRKTFRVTNGGSGNLTFSIVVYESTN